MGLFDASTPATVGEQADRVRTPSRGSTGNTGGNPSEVTTTPPPSGSGDDLLADDPTRIWDQLRAQFPWIDQIGIDPQWFQEVAAETGGNADAVLVRFRQLPQYRARFAGMWRQDGSLRMNEAQYLQTENDYRQLLRQYGYSEDAYAKPEDLVGLFEGEIDPNELGDRLEIQRNIQDAGQSVRDAFYVYAGLDISDDDLFAAIVDPNLGLQLQREYAERVAAENFDYQTFLQRAAEVAPRRAAKLAARADNPVTFDQLKQQAPGLVRKILDVLYTNGGTEVDASLSLEELMSSYEEALLGAAASNAGLELPTRERIAEIRLAGIERAQAQAAYLQFAQYGGSLSGAAQRIGGGPIDQQRFEDAAFFGDGSAQQALAQAAAYEQAAGQTQGRFRFDQDRTGRFTQLGLS